MSFSYHLKVVRTLKTFSDINQFFHFSSVLSIPIGVMGVDGGYFPSICRECLYFKSNLELMLEGTRVRVFWSDNSLRKYYQLALKIF